MTEENTSEHLVSQPKKRPYTVSRRGFLKTVAAVGAGFMIGTNRTRDTTSARAENLPRNAYVEKFRNDYGIIVIDTTVPDELTRPWYESLDISFSKYKNLGLGDFTNRFTGPLNLLINQQGVLLNGTKLFPDKTPQGYAWNDQHHNELVIMQQEGREINGQWFDSYVPPQDYLNYVTHHEPGHTLQYQPFPGFRNFNDLSIILSSPAIQSFKELGYKILSSPDEFGKRPPWELEYDLSTAPERAERNMPEIDSMAYIWTSGNPFIEGTNTCLTEYVLRPEQFQALYPQHFAWTEQRYIPLLRKQLEKLNRG